MKTRLVIIVSLLAIAVALMIGPVSAALTGTTALTGNPAAYVAITVSPASIPLTLVPGDSATDSALDIHLSANKACTVSVADNTGRGAGELGYMGSYTTGAYDTTPAIHLASAIQLVGDASPPSGVAVSALTPPISSAQTLFTGTGVLDNVDCNTNTFTQPVALTDPVLGGTSTYRIDLVFTIAAS